MRYDNIIFLVVTYFWVNKLETIQNLFPQRKRAVLHQTRYVELFIVVDKEKVGIVYCFLFLLPRRWLKKPPDSVIPKWAVERRWHFRRGYAKMLTYNWINMSSVILLKKTVNCQTWRVSICKGINGRKTHGKNCLSCSLLDIEKLSNSNEDAVFLISRGSTLYLLSRRLGAWQEGIIFVISLKMFYSFFWFFFFFFSWPSLFILQFEDFGKSETEVREHMVQLANFLDSVSYRMLTLRRNDSMCNSLSALFMFINFHLGVCSLTTLERMK